MKPDISFHHIASIELRPIDTFTAGEATGCKPFATRELVLTDANGDKFRIGLFAETEEALQPIDKERAALGDAAHNPPPAYDRATGKLVPW